MHATTIEDVKVILTQPGRCRLAIVKVTTSSRASTVSAAPRSPAHPCRRRSYRKHLREFLIGATSPASKTSGRWRWSTALAKRTSTEQRDFGNRPGAVGHQGQAGRHGRLRLARRESPRSCPCLRPRRRRHTARRGRSGQRIRRRRLPLRANPAGLYGGNADTFVKPDGAIDGAYYDPRAYRRATLEMMAHVRAGSALGSSCSTTFTSG